MINLIHAEYYKLWKSSAIKVCILISFLCAGVLTYISYLLAWGRLSESISGSASGLAEVLIISILGSFMAGILVTGDFDTKTIHNIITSGNGRRTVVISKMIVYVSIMMMLLLPYLIVTLIGIGSGQEFAPPFVPSIFITILYDATQLKLDINIIGKIIVIGLISMLIHAARLSFCILIAFKVRKSAVVMVCGFIGNGIIDFLVGLGMDVPVISGIIKLTPYSREFIKCDLSCNAEVLWKAAFVSIAFLVVIAEVTYQMFRKAEIK